MKSGIESIIIIKPVPNRFCLMVSQDSGRCGVDSGGNWGGSVASGGHRGGSVAGEVVSVVSVLDDGSGAGDLDDVLTLDWVWVWHGVRLGDVHGGGHLDDLLNVLDDVTGDGVWLLHVHGLVDDEGLLLDLDHGWVDLLGALESGWHSNADVWDGWLQDLGGVAGNVGLLAVVHLLGDLLWGLGNGHSGLASNVGGVVWGWHADGSWGSSNDSWGDSWGGSVAQWGSGQWSSGQWSSGQWSSGQVMNTSKWSHSHVGWGGAGSSDHCGEDCGHWVHDEIQRVVLSKG